MITKHLHITGLVQGVLFRESMRQRANHLGVTGWVRNCADGSVKAVVQGEALTVGQLIAWARRGPPAARVDAVEVKSMPDEPNYAGFEKKPTA
jgi:acylphosphatase